MKGFGAVMLYLIIGGMLTGLADNAVRSKCPDFRMSDQTFVSLVTLWPAGAGFLLVSNDTGKTGCRSDKR